ncbi:hypothetical protein C8Q80DRAFT_332853 [Daedaleopsis nitida]|nr:hypothetical protein C8Q80DRAFT_332853 [Daedaleopsis nitida]
MALHLSTPNRKPRRGAYPAYLIHPDPFKFVLTAAPRPPIQSTGHDRLPGSPGHAHSVLSTQPSPERILDLPLTPSTGTPPNDRRRVPYTYRHPVFPTARSK